jgi:adenylate cyclase, class 2
MSIEIEVKFRVSDLAAVTERIRQRCGKPVSQETLIDTYFAHPCRDFGQTDEALRIRSGPAGNHITYKGPKWGGPTKTREEIEIAFAESEGPTGSHRMARLLEKLGFQTLAVIGKSRTSYHVSLGSRALQVALDDAWNLGAFAEVETIAEAESGVHVAQEAVLELAKDLGLTEVEPRSYLRMALERASC